MDPLYQIQLATPQNTLAQALGGGGAGCGGRGPSDSRVWECVGECGGSDRGLPGPTCLPAATDLPAHCPPARSPPCTCPPMQVRIVRIFNTYGPRMALDDGRVVSNFVAQVGGCVGGGWVGARGSDLTL